MGGFIKSDVKRVETTALNTKVNKEAFDEFKDYCKKIGYPMNVVIETFMQQYANGRFEMSEEEVLKWKNDNSNVDTLNTTFNKEIYLEFKDTCKRNGFFVKHVITAFMERYSNGEFIMEYVKVKDIKEE